MSARTRSAVTSLVLLAAAAAALLAVWKLVDQRGEGESKAREREARLFSFEPAAVMELEVTARGGTTRLVREGALWRIPALAEDADRGAADALAERMAHARRKAEVAPAAQVDAALLSSTGLAAPRVRVVATLEGGARETLALGERSGFDGSVHVRAGGGPILLAPGDLEYALERGPDDLRDRTALHFEREKVQGLRAESAGKVVWAVERRPAGDGAPAGWQLTAPRQAPARADRVDAALQALGWLRALRFAGGAAQAAGAGLTPPHRSYLLLGEGGAEIGRVEVGREANDSIFVRSSAGPRVLEVDKGSLAALPASPDDLEQKPAPAPAAPPAAGPPKGQERRKG